MSHAISLLDDVTVNPMWPANTAIVANTAFGTCSRTAQTDAKRVRATHKERSTTKAVTNTLACARANDSSLVKRAISAW